MLATTLPALFRAKDGEEGLKRALDELCQRASLAVKAGYSLMILSDRGVDKDYAPIPCLLALAAVHNLLVREETRTQVALITESGEPREVMHFALLSGYGASAINPYLALESVENLAWRGELGDGITPELAAKHFMKAIKKGLLKTFSKMGISTLQSYQGAQVFEAIGLNKELIDAYFAGTTSRIEGIGLSVLAAEAQLKHEYAFRPLTEFETELAVGGSYHQRVNGEYHLLNPLTISKLQQAVRQDSFKTFQEYTDLIDNQSANLCTLRGLMKFKKSDTPVPLEEVEPAKEIVKRFTTGAMSFGSISKEAHETLAIAMNRIGGKSNTGEGGEDEARFTPDSNGDLRRSAVKQVASARFGVTANYLVNADELQIKMAQGAKPGEGGQLPGHKVDEVIARLRHSIPGVGLISPPPHHDIYSIEDLAQLIYDLKNVNPHARIAVKLVAEVGVGTVAAGVAKAHADVVLISGDTGGTGASPAEFHQACGHSVGTRSGRNAAGSVAERFAQPHPRANRRQIADWPRRSHCRSAGRRRIRIRHYAADRDGLHHDAQVPSQHLLGRHRHAGSGVAQAVSRASPSTSSISFSSSPNSCASTWPISDSAPSTKWSAASTCSTWSPPSITGKITGRPAASISRRSSTIRPTPSRVARRCVQAQDHGLEQALDHKILGQVHDTLETLAPIEVKFPVRNIHRSVGTMLSGEIARRYGSAGLPDDTVRIHLTGSAGQSLGAFLAKGVTLSLEGEANDYVGKGLSGGRLMVFPPRASSFAAGRKYHHRQRRTLRRDQWRSVLQRSRGRALCGSQLRSDRGGRGRRRPRLRIHDQRHRAGARLLRQKFRAPV